MCIQMFSIWINFKQNNLNLVCFFSYIFSYIFFVFFHHPPGPSTRLHSCVWNGLFGVFYVDELITWLPTKRLVICRRDFFSLNISNCSKKQRINGRNGVKYCVKPHNYFPKAAIPRREFLPRATVSKGLLTGTRDLPTNKPVRYGTSSLAVNS